MFELNFRKIRNKLSYVLRGGVVENYQSLRCFVLRKLTKHWKIVEVYPAFLTLGHPVRMDKYFYGRLNNYLDTQALTSSNIDGTEANVFITDNFEVLDGNGRIKVLQIVDPYRKIKVWQRIKPQ